MHCATRQILPFGSKIPVWQLYGYFSKNSGIITVNVFDEIWVGNIRKSVIGFIKIKHNYKPDFKGM